MENVEKLYNSDSKDNIDTKNKLYNLDSVDNIDTMYKKTDQIDKIDNRNNI